MVVLLAPDGADRDWAAGVALEMASSWGEEGHRVVLADGALERPSLHREAGLTNSEGLSDAACFGASVSRVAQPVPGRSFFLISAGSPVGDGAAVARSARWARIVEGFREAGVVLAVFVREGEASTEAFLDAATDVVVLHAGEDEAPAGVVGAAGRVRARVGPAERPAPVGADEPVGAEEPAAIEEPVGAEIPGRDEEAALAEAGGLTAPSLGSDEAAAVGGPAGGDVPASAGAPVATQATAEAVRRPGSARSTGGRRRRQRTRGRKTMLWVALGILVVVLVVVLGASRPG